MVYLTFWFTYYFIIILFYYFCHSLTWCQNPSNLQSEGIIFLTKPPPPTSHPHPTANVKTGFKTTSKFQYSQFFSDLISHRCQHIDRPSVRTILESIQRVALLSNSLYYFIILLFIILLFYYFIILLFYHFVRLG